MVISKNLWSVHCLPKQLGTRGDSFVLETTASHLICGKQTSALVPECALLSLFLCVCQLQPLFELRCSNNVVHLHTCADSCAALVNLLQYLVSQGDLHPPPRQTSPTEIAGQKLPVRQFSVYVFEQATLSGCDAEFELSVNLKSV